MAETPARRRGHGEDAIYFDAAKNRYVGAVSLGFGPDEALSGRLSTRYLQIAKASLARAIRFAEAHDLR